MKTRKGLVSTYVKILVVILIIVIGIHLVIKFASNGYSKEEMETLKTNMLLIQGKAEIIAQKVEIKEKNAKYIGTQVKEKENEEIIQNLINNNIIDINSKDSNLYCLNNEDIKELGLDNIYTDNYYIVDYKKNDVIYPNGMENENGDIIYKLSEMK